MSDKKLIIFDLENVLIPTRNSLDSLQRELLPGVLEKLQQLYGEGVNLAVAANLPNHRLGEVTDICRWICQEAGIALMLKLANYPESYSYKPNPGMVLSLIVESEVLPRQVLIVGQSALDEQTAFNVGVEFRRADVFFGRVYRQLEKKEWITE